MRGEQIRHEIVSSNPGMDVRFYLSESQGDYVAPHWHDHLEMIYMLEGSIRIKCENREMDVHANEMTVLNSREIHSIWSTKNQALVLQVPEKLLEKYVPEMSLLRFDVGRHSGRPSDVTRMERLMKICHDMHVIYEVRPEGYLLKFDSLLYDLLFTLVHSYSIRLVEKEATKSAKIREQLKEILLYLDHNHHRQITVQETAEHFGYHPDYLSRLLKRQIGLTVREYLYEIRMNYICQDLMDTEDYIHEIFERHGCSNDRVAKRRFAERYGCTPKEMRKQKTAENTSE